MIQITTHPQNLTVNGGSLAEFTVVASADTADGRVSYKWQKAEALTPTVFVDIPGALSSVYSILSTTLADSGDVFRCVVTAANLTEPVNSNPATLTVLPSLLSVIQQPQGLTAVPTEAAGFSVVAQSSPSTFVAYQWQYSADNATWSNIPQATAASYSVAFVTYASRGWYRCALSNPLASNTPLYTSAARLDVELAEMTIVTQPESQQVFTTERCSVSVGAEITFSQQIIYQWQYSTTGTRNWLALENSNSATYTIQSADLDDTGYYRCVLSNANAVITSLTTQVIQISVRKPTITITSNPIDQSQVLGLVSGFSVSATIDYAGQPLSYSWQYSTDQSAWNDIPGQTSNVIRLTPTAQSDAGYYRCAIKNSLARISPVYSQVAALEVLKPTLQITSQPVGQTAYLTRNAAFSVQASIQGTNIIRYQWQYSTNGSSGWVNVPDQTLSTLVIDELTQSQVGFYRCAVSNPDAIIPTLYSDAVELVGLVPSITIQTSNVGNLTIDYEDEVSFNIQATSLILINYQWQYRATQSGNWIDITEQTSPTYSFTPDVLQNGYQYRCRLSNRAGVEVLSGVANLTINPFFYISDQPAEEVNVRRSLSKTVKLITVARSTNQSQLTYQWQTYNALTSTWVTIPGATHSTLTLDVSDVEEVETDYRCAVSFGGNTVNSRVASVILREDLNLYFKGCFEGTTNLQDEAIEELGIVGSVVDKSCSRESINTCGYTFEELFDLYPIYNNQKGLYRSWGDIVFNWQVNSSTPNLLFSANDNKWSVSTFREIVSYEVGDRVILMEDDGHVATVYEATQNILSFPGAFDSSKWKKICYIETTIPAGLPSLEELYSRYSAYDLQFFYSEWGDVNTEWEEETYEQSLSFCMGLGTYSTLAELEKCIDERKLSTNKWDRTRVRKEFFYRAGDVALVEGECKDIVCAYIAKQDIPATEQVYEEYRDFKLGVYWQKLYCLATGRNKCLEYQRKRDVHAGYDVVELGSKGHFVERPVPYRLRPTPETLDRRASVSDQPVVLTQEQIDALNQPQED